jgi:ADP-heptose:LPS heptosyltransferase
MANAGLLETLLEGPPRRLLVFRALVIGDMLCAVPALRALRHAYPDAHITLCGLPWARDFRERFANYLDDFLEFPGFPGLPERPFDVAAFPAFLQHAQREHYDVALQLHGSGSFVNPLMELLGARLTAGYYIPGEYRPHPATYLVYPDDVPEVRRHLRLMEHLGIASQGEHLELPLTLADFDALQALPAWSELQSHDYVCIHPGARYLSRRWLPERFALVADRLAESGLKIVITGTPPEAPIALAVQAHMTAPAINLCGQTSFGALAALLSRSRLLVANDTGVSHVAAALRVSSVIVVTGSNARRWAPLDRQRHRVVVAQVPCQPCEHVECPIGFPCATAVTVEEVVERALALLAGERSLASLAG